MSKCAFISGASRGIGKGIAEVLASAGYNLALCCVNNIDSLEEYATNLQKSFGIHAKAYRLDVSSFRNGKMCLPRLWLILAILM